MRVHAIARGRCGGGGFGGGTGLGGGTPGGGGGGAPAKGIGIGGGGGAFSPHAAARLTAVIGVVPLGAVSARGYRRSFPFPFRRRFGVGATGPGRGWRRGAASDPAWGAGN